MDSSELIRKEVESILISPSGPVHPAWVTEATPAITTSTVFLKLFGNTFIAISPCEVDFPGERYPSLGLELATCESTELKQPDGRVIKASKVEELSEILPQTILQVEESDPLEEGAVSQYAFQFECGKSFLVQHIMPPMTLGVSVDDTR